MTTRRARFRPAAFGPGVHNATAGSAGGVPAAIFQANGVDAFGMPHPGTLFIEDLNGGPFGTGLDVKQEE